MADKIKQITDVLDMLAEDTSIPRNIRKGATDAKARLLDTKEAMDVRATGAIVILDDLANDPNIPLHGRTIIWNVISQLEVLHQPARGPQPAELIPITFSLFRSGAAQRRCSATMSRKFWNISGPCSVFSTSGWNCTP